MLGKQNKKQLEQNRVIESYKKKSNVAGLIFLVSVSLMLYLLPEIEGNIWEGEDILPRLIHLTIIGSWLYALWAYAKAKGRSGAWGVLAGFASVIGLIILILLKDKSGALLQQKAAQETRLVPDENDEAEIKSKPHKICPYCNKANVVENEICECGELLTTQAIVGR